MVASEAKEKIKAGRHLVFMSARQKGLTKAFVVL